MISGDQMQHSVCVAPWEK